MDENETKRFLPLTTHLLPLFLPPLQESEFLTSFFYLRFPLGDSEVLFFSSYVQRISLILPRKLMYSWNVRRSTHVRIIQRVCVLYIHPIQYFLSSDLHTDFCLYSITFTLPPRIISILFILSSVTHASLHRPFHSFSWLVSWLSIYPVYKFHLPLWAPDWLQSHTERMP